MTKSYNSVDEVLKDVCYEQAVQISNVRSKIHTSIQDEKKADVIIFNYSKK